MKTRRAPRKVSREQLIYAFILANSNDFCFLVDLVVSFQMLSEMCKKFGIDTRACLFKERRYVMRCPALTKSAYRLLCIVCIPAPFTLFPFLTATIMLSPHK